MGRSWCAAWPTGDPVSLSAIERVDVRVAQYPLPRPLGTAIHAMRSVGVVVVDVVTADGVRGQGFLFALNADRIRSFAEAVDGLSRYYVGRRPTESSRCWDDVWSALNPSGHKGIGISALSALDVSCWDAVGRGLGVSLADLWGRCRTSVPAYASSGLWLSDDLEAIAAEAASFVEQGFRAVKLRVGSARAEDDVARAAAVRSAIGPEVALHVDANQGFTPKQAIRLGRLLDEFDIAWFEEPVVTHDLRGAGEARSGLPMPVATGETEFTRFGMADLVDAGAADVLMPDLQRIGGYTEFRRADAFAMARDIPTSSHFFTEHSLVLAGSLPNCGLVEHVDWFAPLFVEAMELVDGELVVPTRPGSGFTIDDGFVDAHLV